MEKIGYFINKSRNNLDVDDCLYCDICMSYVK